MNDHTLVEIAQDKAERFAACAAAADADEMTVEPAAAPRKGPPGAGGGRPFGERRGPSKGRANFERKGPPAGKSGASSRKRK